jgi:hypothetical protein
MESNGREILIYRKNDEFIVGCVEVSVGLQIEIYMDS